MKRRFLSRPDAASSTRLPKGNVLITESNNGRAFEVTREGEIVWEFLSPYHAGDANEFVAALPEAIRPPEDFPSDWLEK